MEIVVDRTGPELRVAKNSVAPAGRNVEEFAFTAGFLESSEIATVVRNRIEPVAVTVEPDRRLRVMRASFEEGVIDGGRIRARERIRWSIAFGLLVVALLLAPLPWGRLRARLSRHPSA
jgi:hypothetical protein